MYLSNDVSSALKIVEEIKVIVDKSDGKSQSQSQSTISNDLNRLISLLDNPIIRSIVNIQESLGGLNKQLTQHPSLLPFDFDISLSGELILKLTNLPKNKILTEISDVNENDLNGSQIEKQSLDSLVKHPLNKSTSADEISYRTSSFISDTSKSETDSIFLSKWAEIEVIDLINDGPGLGFGIIGGKSIGVIVKTILHNGVAYRDNRLKSGDFILQIGDINLHEMSSEQVASVLRQSAANVRLIVARPANPLSSSFKSNDSTIFVPAKLLNKPEELNMYVCAQGHSDIFNEPLILTSDSGKIQRKLSVGSKKSPIVSPKFQDRPSETEILFVELKKNQKGLGITIAGYVCEKEALSGIFVKSIAKGSAADLCGKIQVNDRIIQVDNIPLQDCSNNDAVEILRNCDNTVILCLERYLYGPKYEQLQQKDIFEAESEMQQNNNGQQKDNRNMNKLLTENVSLPELLHKNASNSLILNYIESERNVNDLSKAVSVDLEDDNDNDNDAHYHDKRKLHDGRRLEGSVHFESGRKMQSVNLIRSISPDESVATNALFKVQDEMFELNGQKSIGFNNVESVCKRQCDKKLVSVKDQYGDKSLGNAQCQTSRKITNRRLYKAKSESSIPSTGSLLGEESTANIRSRSLEPLTGLAVWSQDVEVIELIKGERGLGFSILEYQDPINPQKTVIVIQSLVPGGVAHLDGKLIPGDRIISVNDIDLENSTIEEAVQAFKKASKGVVKLTVSKPLPLSDSENLC